MQARIVFNYVELFWSLRLSCSMQMGICASGKTTKTMERASTETGPELSLTTGMSRLGKSPEGVNSSGTPFNNEVWLWRSPLEADKWYSCLFVTIPLILWPTRCLDFLPDFCVDIGGSSVVDDLRSTSTFTVEFERLIKSMTRPPEVEPAWQCV